MDTPPKPDLRISYLEHRSMRDDAARLTELVGTAGPADVGRWEQERGRPSRRRRLSGTQFDVRCRQPRSPVCGRRGTGRTAR
jgi:hypothetical protein